MKKRVIGNATLYLGDCMDLMKQYPDKYFDLAIVDPPYFKGPNKQSFYGGKTDSPFRTKNNYHRTKNWNIPDMDYYIELKRVSDEQIIFGINYFNFHPVPSGRIVWDKKNDKSTFSNGEIASCSLIKSVRFFRFLWNGYARENYVKNGKRIHPTQKPIDLYKWLLSTYAKPGWKILDTHFGSGSIAIACNELGFELTASEIDEVHFNDACKRIEQALSENILCQT